MSDAQSFFNRILNFFRPVPKDKKELVNILRNVCDDKLIDATSLNMIEGVLSAPQSKVKDIMVPRSQMITLKENLELSEILPIVTKNAHSRFPVFSSNNEDVVGILLAKDLLNYSAHHSDFKDFKIADIIRTAIFIPESKRLDSLLKEFRENRNHMAIVINEYGNVVGLATIEDVLEQIVGEIEDEFDIASDAYFKQHDNSTYTVKAITPIEEFNKQFKTNYDTSENETIGGLILQRFSFVPQQGDSIKVGEIKFKVVRATTRRIQLLNITISQ